ncbi:hypothetical protein DPMN_003969 [Dreissena polymorpha]|uniref:Uncharacterized protein n=1 Tax=Dreissena polymorpha TaxID=45954 RepID=A0A9D4MLY4_DREPO|nr:hypothetical protein DPMN_003969 [Dreissena polymorpha]
MRHLFTVELIQCKRPTYPGAGRGSPNGGRIQAHLSCYPTEARKMAELGGSTPEEAHMECDLDHGKRHFWFLLKSAYDVLRPTNLVT